jgi:hypothetical protein
MTHEFRLSTIYIDEMTGDWRKLLLTAYGSALKLALFNINIEYNALHSIELRRAEVYARIWWNLQKRTSTQYGKINHLNSSPSRQIVLILSTLQEPNKPP